MTYGICGLSLVPLREVAQFDAPLVSEVLNGELFEVIGTKKNGAISSLQTVLWGGLTMHNLPI